MYVINQELIIKLRAHFIYLLLLLLFIECEVQFFQLLRQQFDTYEQYEHVLSDSRVVLTIIRYLPTIWQTDKQTYIHTYWNMCSQCVWTFKNKTNLSSVYAPWN